MATDFYARWQEQLAQAEQVDGLDSRISTILYLAKAICDEAEHASTEASDQAGGPSHRYGLYKIPQHHMIRLRGMLYNGTTE